MGNSTSATDKEHANSFVTACISGDFDKVKELLADLDDVEVKRRLNLQGDQGNHALGAAAYNGNFDLCSFLLEKGAPLELKNDIGTSPLWLAAGYGHEKLCNFLLEQGADVNSINTTQDSPLIAAISKDHDAIVKLLLEKGANVYLKNRSKDTAISVVLSKNKFELLKLISDAMRKQENSENEEKTCKHLINLANVDGITPLAMASSNDNVDILNHLLLLGADLKTVDRNGSSPFAIACYCGNLNVVQSLLENEDIQEITKTLINQPDYQSQTPLWLASSKNHSEVVKLLLNRDVDSSIKNKDGIDALGVAKANDASESLALLESQLKSLSNKEAK